MKASLFLPSLLCFSVSVTAHLAAKDLPALNVGFKKIQLLDKYISEGASIGDINADGHLDVIAGPLWWQGPDFKTSHSYAPVKTFPITGPGLAGYSNNFFTFPSKVTPDKWPDILKVGVPSQPAHLAINPGEKPFLPDNTENTCEHGLAQENICNESPQLLQILPGKKEQLLAYSQNHITLAQATSDPKAPWEVFNISPDDGRFQQYSHGLGAADIDGDQLPDILEKEGWWQQPANWDKKSPWIFYPYPFAPKQGGAQMFGYDIDGDGDTDVVTALNAHSYGLAWYEQIKSADGKITFTQHLIMPDGPSADPAVLSFSQAHAMACADIDGDGINDIVTGKCYFAHNGNDPGANDPAVLYWFRTTRSKEGTTFTPHLIDDDSGVGRQISTADLNADGKEDIVISNKKGTYLFLQTDKANEPKKNASKAKSTSKAIFIEGEALTISQRSGIVEIQNMETFKIWSGNAQLWWRNAKVGDQIELTFKVPQAGKYYLGAGFTKAKDYGIAEFSLNGKTISKPIDFYNEQVIHTGAIILSPNNEKISFKAGLNTLNIKIIGSNPKAIKSYMFGLDYLVLHPDSIDDLKNSLSVLIAPPTPADPASAIKDGNNLQAKKKSPEQELATFTLPAGFRAELVSSEIQGTVKPISLAFDDAGRLWTQTAREYPKDKDVEGYQTVGEDHILVFENPTASGVQTPKIFASGLHMPASILPYDDRVIATHGPELILLQDLDGDGKSDKKTTLMSGFGVQDTHTTVHQLTRLPGGWIGFSQGCLAYANITLSNGKTQALNRAVIGKFRPDGSELKITAVGLNNIWAWATDKTGTTFIHEANDYGYSQIPYQEDATYPSFVAGKRFPDSPIHPPTAQNLGLGGTGFSGIAISDDRTRGFPQDWQNVHFVANPITNTINTVNYTIDEKGIYHFKKLPDFLESSDPMFRPVAVAFGPDGCLYIIDWYNRIISHNEVPTDHPARDKISGRIWRISHVSQKNYQPLNLETAPTDQLITHLESNNAWEKSAASNQISKRNATALIPALKSLLTNNSTDIGTRIQIIWTLENLHYFDPKLWEILLSDKDPHIRFQALCALTEIDPPLAQTDPLIAALAPEKSYLVLNQIARHYRETAHPLNSQHKSLLQSLITPADQIGKPSATGWNGPYLALGGDYEKTFLNTLVKQALNRRQAPAPSIDETRWNKTIATHPAKSTEEQQKIAHEIKTLTKAFESAPEGDPTKGKAHFAARCAACHAIEAGQTGFAPALNGGKSRTPEALLTAILDPNAAAESIFLTYRIIKNDGSTLEGFRSNLTPKEITLTYMGGGEIKVPLTEIKDAGYLANKSVMLENMITGMPSQDIIDLLTYIRSVK